MTNTWNDHEGSEYARELETQLAYDRKHPESRWNRTDTDDNPNRPTPEHYCANCGETPSNPEQHGASFARIGTDAWSTPLPLTESIYVSDLITLLEKETHIDRKTLYGMIGRAATAMGCLDTVTA